MAAQQIGTWVEGMDPRNDHVDALKQVTTSTLLLLQILACLDTTSIRHTLLGPASQLVASWNDERHDCDSDAALNEATALDLIQNGNTHVRMTSEVRDLLRGTMTTSNPQSIFARARTLVITEWPYESDMHDDHLNNFSDVRIWTAGRSFLKHIESLRNLYEEIHNSISENKRDNLLFASLLVDATSLCVQFMDTHRAELLLKTAENIFNGERSIFWFQNNLRVRAHKARAEIAIMHNDPVSQYQQATACHAVETIPAVSSPRSTTPYGNAGIISAVANHGAALIRHGFHDEALTLLLLAECRLEKHHEIFAADHNAVDNQARLSISIAYALLGDPGSAGQALDVLHKAQGQLQTHLGPTMKCYTSTWGDLLSALATAYELHEQPIEAAEHHLLALRHYRDTLGPTHPKTADAAYKSALDEMRNGALEAAAMLLDMAIEVYTARLPELWVHLRLVRAVVMRASVLFAVGEAEGAAVMWEEARGLFGVWNEGTGGRHQGLDVLNEWDALESLIGYEIR